MTEKCWICKRTEKEVRIDFDKEEYAITDDKWKSLSDLLILKPIDNFLYYNTYKVNICEICRAIIEAISYSQIEDNNVEKTYKQENTLNNLKAEFITALDLLRRIEQKWNG